MAPDLAFDILADPVWREILSVLAEHEECRVGELSERISRVGRTRRVQPPAGTAHRGAHFRTPVVALPVYYSVDPSGPAQDVIRQQQQQELFQCSLDSAKAAAESGEPVTPGYVGRRAV